MDRNSLELVIQTRIKELEEQKAKHQEEIDRCDIKICELKALGGKVREKDDEIKKDIVSQNIKRDRPNTLKNLLVDEKDGRRFNLFLEFMDKCEDETVYRRALEKMPKLSSYIYGKRKLWNGWLAFKDDYHAWVNREGKWEGILDNKTRKEEE